MELISETSLLYFFSALAQCASGFAALVGVFAVFRLQVNTLTISEEYDAVRNWLRVDCTLQDTVSLPRNEVKNKLLKIISKEWAAAPPEVAQKMLNKINDAEKVNRALVYEAHWPLKLWGLIFLLAIGVTPYAKYYVGCSAIFVYLLFITGVIIALFLTGKFVQRCLSF